MAVGTPVKTLVETLVETLLGMLPLAMRRRALLLLTEKLFQGRRSPSPQTKNASSPVFSTAFSKAFSIGLGRCALTPTQLL